MAENPFSPIPTGGKQNEGIAAGTPQAWEIGEVLSEAWEKFQANAVPMVVATVGMFVVLFIVNIIIQIPLQVVTMAAQLALGRTDPDKGALIAMAVTLPLSFLAMFLQLGVQSVVQAGVHRMALMTVRGSVPDLSQMTAGVSNIWTIIGTQLLMFLAIMGGYLLCLVPAFIFAVGLYFGQMFAIDTGLGAVDCLKASWRATDGQKLQLTGLGLVFGLGGSVVILLTCGLASLVVLPVGYLTMAIVYTRITGRTQDGMADPNLLDSYA